MQFFWKPAIDPCLKEIHNQTGPIIASSQGVFCGYINIIFMHTIGFMHQLSEKPFKSMICHGICIWKMVALGNIEQVNMLFIMQRTRVAKIQYKHTAVLRSA